MAERPDSRAAPPDDGGERGVFSTPQDSLREPEPGELPSTRARQLEPKPAGGSGPTLALLAVLLLLGLAILLGLWSLAGR
ncbi:MAG TPA: hypothetical protein VJR89_02410 [Polyangiales bacterium]|nr:hypothetical protein [Polyangiales bacterium]